MNLITWLAVGSLIGWLARMLAVNTRLGMVPSIVVGAVGALLAGWLLSPLIGSSTVNQDNFNIWVVAVAVIGAMGLLALVDLAQRKASR